MSVTLNSGGVIPTEITKVLREFGWKPIYGGYDYAYQWDKDIYENQENEKYFWNHINNTHNTLKPLNVYYNLRTYEHGKEGFTPIYCRE